MHSRLLALIIVLGLSQASQAGLVVGTAMVSDAQELTRLNGALSLLQKGDVDQAYGELDMISPRTPSYRYAYSEMQKIHYRRGEWDKFFGFAAYYRKRLVSVFFDPDLLLLEALALTKHCQFNAARGILAEAHALAQDESSLARVQGVEDLLFLQSKNPGNVETRAVGTPFKAFSRVLEWKMPEAARDPLLTVVVKNPRALRVYVRNLCKGGAS